ncbi:unnamed protein product [Lactuca saligna]|uniref:MULE transposase domain-containing protein n=1 Tax=Lactuca saligna TaxID=75948 RepID=A0AA35YD49_LACSI|nr:unnamed protein product [Lactuca saligna]
METVDDFDTIGVELDEFFKHKQRSRCKDEFLNTLTDEALDECTIPEINLYDFEGMSEDEAPQEKQSDSEGDDEDKLQFQYSTLDPKVKWNNMKPVLREMYESPHQLKLYLTTYSISMGYPIRFKKCDSVRLVVVCASDPEKFQCPFVVRDSWMSTERSFQIKKMVEQHTCVRNFHSANLMDPTWIARAKCREISLIDGKLTDHYAKVWDYGHELMRSNPGSIIQISITVIVEIENKPNWQWFLELLHDDLELQGCLDLCAISDQHEGLLEAVKVVLPHVEHIQCARHVYVNFRKVFSGIEFKNMFWTVAKSTVEGEFKLNMEKTREVNPAAYDHLMAREPKSWCRAFFKGGMSCEVVENGMAECFNAIILDARKKPLL